MSLAINPQGIFPFYKNLKSQVHRRYKGCNRCHITAPSNTMLLPFQIPYSETILSYDLDLFDCDDNLIENIKCYFPLNIYCTESGNLLSYNGEHNDQFTIPDCEKPHYLVVTINGEKFYSELFCCDCQFDSDEDICITAECYDDSIPISACTGTTVTATTFSICECDDLNSPICEQRYYLYEDSLNRELLSEGQRCLTIDVEQFSGITSTPYIIQREITTAYNQTPISGLFQINYDPDNLCATLSVSDFNPPPDDIYTVCVTKACNDADLSGAIVQVGNETGITDSSGCAYFANVNVGDTISVSAPIDEFITNGLSPTDLVLLRQWILGINLPEYAWQMIAADMNCSGSVSTLDLVLLQQIILGFPTHPSVCKNWEFMPKSEYTQFMNPWNTFSYPSPYVTTETVTSTTGTSEFCAIKRGDLNCSGTDSVSVEQTTTTSDQ